MLTALPSTLEQAHSALLQRGGEFASSQRRTAWDRFVQAGLPHGRLESWKYTPTGVLGRSFVPAPAGQLPAEALPRALPGFTRFIWVNGRPIAGPQPAVHPAVSVVTTLPPAPEEGREEGLALLNRALFEQAALIEVPAGTDAGRVELVHLVTASAGGAMVHPRVQLRLGKGARLTLVETFLGPAQASYLVNAASTVELGVDAHLVHCVVQAEGDQGVHLASMGVQLETGSRLEAFVLQQGAALSRRELKLWLCGERAHAELEGLLSPGTGQHHDLHVRVEHAAPRATSRQRVRGVISGTGRGVFTGHVHVHAGAAGSDAAQDARALLLSREGEMDLRPHLEIHVDEVKATHAATVGQLDPDQLFYLRARGIPEASARELLTTAFVREVLEPLPVESLREQALAHLSTRAAS